MINKINSVCINQKPQNEKSRVSFGGMCLLQKEYGSVVRVPCESKTELKVLNKLIKFIKKGKIKFAEKFQTSTGPWKEKYLKSGFRKEVIQVQTSPNSSFPPKIEYLEGGKRLYILQQTEKGTEFLYNAILDGLKKCEGGRLNIKNFKPKCEVVPFVKK